MRVETAIPLDKRVSLDAGKDDAALRKACKEFESVLVAQMLHKMRETVPKTDLFGSRDKEELFQSMLDDEFAARMSNSGSLMLADLLYQQLSNKKSNDSDS